MKAMQITQITEKKLAEDIEPGEYFSGVWHSGEELEVRPTESRLWHCLGGGSFEYFEERRGEDWPVFSGSLQGAGSGYFTGYQPLEVEIVLRLG